MKGLLITLSAFGVMGLAYWAYQENYRTQSVQKETAEMQREIGALRHRLAMLNAEWAYLNRPQRLAELADLNFETLGLMPFLPEQYGMVEQVAFPVPDLPEIPEFLLTELNPVDVVAEVSR